jgi:hypothetical protein
MIEYRKFITRQIVRAYPQTLFVFGDNSYRTGFGGQAKEMRGEPNAVGIITKLKSTMEESSFLDDSLFNGWFNRTVHDFYKLLMHNGIIIWPEDNIGTGLAQLPYRAPKIFAEIERLRKRLENLR